MADLLWYDSWAYPPIRATGLQSCVLGGYWRTIIASIMEMAHSHGLQRTRPHRSPAACRTPAPRPPDQRRAGRTRPPFALGLPAPGRSEEHTSELQSLMRISYAVFSFKQT